MPTYEWRCKRGHKFDRYLKVEERNGPQACDCGAPGLRILSLPTVYVQPSVHYTSPIDGRPITSMKARIEDLARNGCSPYDPEQKTDYNRRHKESEERLEKAVDETVERELAKMPARKREKLEAELQSGVTAEPLRTAVPAKSIIKEIKHG